MIYNISFQNLTLYGAVIPSFGTGKKDNAASGGGKKGDDEEILWVTDPKNRQRAIEIISQMV